MNSFSYLSGYDQGHEHDAPREPLSLSVRFALLEDLADIVDILTSSFYSKTGVRRFFLPLFRVGIYEDLRHRLSHLQSSHCICLVASVSSRTGSQVIGTVEVSFRPNTPLHLPNFYYYPYISNLAVRTQYRQQGVAQRLLSACETLAVEHGYYQLYLHVLENNRAAKQLYLKAGYQLHQADQFWCSILFRRSRRFLLSKQLGN